MFEFLFKRQGGKTDNGRGTKTPLPAESAAAAAPSADAGPSNKRGAAAQAGAAPARAPSAVREGQAEQLKNLGGDEARAVDFILQCEFSELRLAAAELVHSRAALERVHGAIRNTDRRVAKLMQARLDAIRHHDAELARGQATLAQARALLVEEQLTPNQVADLDRKWAIIAAPELQEEYAPVRAGLGERLEAQVQLQRAMIDRLSALRRLETEGLNAAEMAARLDAMQAEQGAALAAPERTSLPRSLVAEFASEHARVSSALATIAQSQAALAAREAALTEWQAQPVAELNADTLRRAWQKLPPLPEGATGTALHARFEALLASLPQPVRKAPAAPQAARGAGQPEGERRAAGTDTPGVEARAAKPAKGADQAFIDNMDALEAALQQGSLAHAAELAKVLKETKSKGMRLTAPQADRLAHLRAELKRLSDWARWGGNVSREELIKTVEALPTQNLAMAELAKKVGSMRERWKALDSLSGAAPKSLWERFDHACTVAYAPAAAHFRHLADERHANAAKGEAIVQEATAEIARLESGEADWKHVAGTVQRLRLAWSHLGAIDRKDKKRLDTLFGAALTTLQGPLEEQRKAEVEGREELIDEVLAIDPHDRHAVDHLRDIQARWQEHARALPLERKAEQALWQRFRGACDDLFARRKETAHAADIERRAHEAAKEAISARLEAAAPEATAASAPKLLRDAAHEWQAIGPVPRAHEARVEKRYHEAVARVQHHADLSRRAAGLAQAGALRDKVRACQELEDSLAQPEQAVSAADWRARWAALLPAGAEYDPTLDARFEAALTALDTDRKGYARLLEANRPTLLAELLRQEVAAGIDSGAEFARDRLKLQVEALQSTLKAGNKPAGRHTALHALCALPALVDERTAHRIEQLLMRAAREGK
ncbi:MULTISPECIES: DUF349 domain-containing protein [unclassified Massilia]|uniref:DUF349 domain-containing protein n=1 Tax=unclassified Massilia TaxID=2609279 RepID=UPI001781281E|nr:MULTISPECIES: DUF349 domain-containing protein [unclassified Massilia]MBD8530474.1 DUF349 domain-containing protein [Massilia sp. CFBP 13647]MBD8674228.1 DUF349 domain-containing protein [Massilia sp. CFBP 13721]